MASTDYINEMIETYLYEGFNDAQQLDYFNLRNFLDQTLELYEKSEIDNAILINIADALEDYFYDTFGKDFPESSYPVFKDDDPRSIGLTVINYMNPIIKNFFMFPEDIPHFKKFLKSPSGAATENHKMLRAYVKQFNFIARLKEAERRGYMDQLSIYHKGELKGYLNSK